LKEKLRRKVEANAYSVTAPVRGLLRVTRQHDLQGELFAIAGAIATEGHHN
jgi:hypothetical protein